MPIGKLTVDPLFAYLGPCYSAYTDEQIGAAFSDIREFIRTRRGGGHRSYSRLLRSKIDTTLSPPCASPTEAFNFGAAHRSACRPDR
jgi:hypothetical protein